MQATPECFAHLTHLLQVLAGGRVCAMLEVTGEGTQGGFLGQRSGGQEHGSQVPTWYLGGASCLG